MKKKTPGTFSLPHQTRQAIANQVSGPDGKPQQAVQTAIMKVLGVQRPLVLAYLRMLSRRHPGASAEQLAGFAERDYLRAVTGTGAAGGATAIVPGLGTVASLGVSAGVAVTFVETSALYAQAIAELHGVAVDEPEKARTLIMAVLLGDEASGLLAGVSDQIIAGPKGVAAWGSMFATATGQGGAWSTVGKELQTRFLKHFVVAQGASALGRAVPFGVGAAIGGIANRVLGRRVVRSTRQAFGALSALPMVELRRMTATELPPVKDEVVLRALAAAEVEEAVDAIREARAQQVGQSALAQ